MKGMQSTRVCVLKQRLSEYVAGGIWQRQMETICHILIWIWKRCMFNNYVLLPKNPYSKFLIMEILLVVWISEC